MSPRPPLSFTDGSPWTLGGARRLDVDLGEGRAYRLGLSVPITPSPSDGFPLLVVLDGDALFATATEMARRLSARPSATGVEPTVVLGVGPTEATGGGARRRRDHTFCPCTLDGEGIGEGGGGARFLDDLLDTLIPMAEASAPVDPIRRTLFGHSLSGLFVLGAMARRPSAFDRWVAASPSLWWSKEATFDRLATLETGSVGELILRAGEREAADTPRAQARAMVPHLDALAQALCARQTARTVDFAILPGHDHASIVDSALRTALRRGLTA